MKLNRQYVYLQGGLGNQMFQYAFYLSIKQHNINTKYDCSLALKDQSHNGYELEKVLTIKPQVSTISHLLGKLFAFLSFHKQKTILKYLSYVNITLIEDNVPSIYKPNIFHKKGYVFYLGYWQTEKYFKGIENIIRESFSFNLDLLSTKTKKCTKNIQTSNSISIHIRRGDYLKPQYNHLYGNICTLEYYQKAISIIKKKYNNNDIHFYIFSDDITWVKNNLNISPSTFIDWNTKDDSWQDMFMMSQCKHNIIANSSFSWWGAWLNNNPQKTVICPSRFLNVDEKSDIIPQNWIKI